MMKLRHWFVAPLLCVAAFAQAQGGNNPKPSSALSFEGAVVIKHWEPPTYSQELLAAKVEGEVSLTFIVGTDGSLSDIQIRKTRDPRLNDLAVENLKKWVFEPAVSEGKAIRMDCEQTIVFRLNTPKKADLPLTPPLPLRPARRVAAKGMNMPMPDYPEELENWSLRGSVLFEAEVSEDGHPVNPRLLSASHPAFVRPAFDCLKRWSFVPAKQGRVPVKDKVRIPMEYDHPMSSRKELLEKNGISAADGGELKASAGLPLIIVRYEPVYPFEALQLGRPGKAVVEFTVDGGGNVSETKVVEASEPEFGASFAANVSTWVFEPALSEGKGMAITLRATHQFTPPAKEDTESNLRRLLTLRTSSEGIPSTKVLDAKLKPLYRVAPKNPATEQMKESVQVSLPVVIDREGRVRLVEVRPEANNAFGWAAAQAISNWVFETPLAQGQPTDVRVVVPFSFTP